MIDSSIRSVQGGSLYDFGVTFGQTLSHELGHDFGLHDQYDNSNGSTPVADIDTPPLEGINFMTARVNFTVTPSQVTSLTLAFDNPQRQDQVLDWGDHDSARDTLLNRLIPWFQRLEALDALNYPTGNTPTVASDPGGSAPSPNAKNGTLGRIKNTLPLSIHSQFSSEASGDLTAPLDWTTRGAASINGNTVLLNEHPHFNSSASRTFVIPEGTNSLTFTINSAHFRDNGRLQPPDAFEMALLNADTMTPLLDTADGLEDTDALLNIQQTGEVFFGPRVHIAGVTTSGQPLSLDGPLTVTIDLTGIAAGTRATLFFDLLGFGPTESSLLLTLGTENAGGAAAKPVVEPARVAEQGPEERATPGREAKLAAETRAAPARRVEAPRRIPWSC